MKVFSSKEHLFLFYLILLFTNFQLSAVEILVKATARDNYFRPIKSDGEYVEESYTFCKGKYYPYEYEKPEDIIRKQFLLEMSDPNVVFDTLFSYNSTSTSSGTSTSHNVGYSGSSSGSQIPSHSRSQIPSHSG